MTIPWKLKSFVFSAIDTLSADRLLYIMQKHVTGNSTVTKLDIEIDWLRHEEALNKYDKKNIVFEFGAGKSLAQNLYLSRIVEKQVVVDLNPMIDIDLVERSRSLLARQFELRSKKEIRSLGDLRDYGIEYRAPYDASSTDFENGSVDACISTNTLEHIPEGQIKKILTEIHRILKVDGIISAKIDYSDHYAHTDDSISRLNFLNYSDEEWRKYNHRCHYQNRLRHYDYIKIFENCGFAVVEEKQAFSEKSISQSLSERFASMPKSWAATSAFIVLRKL